MPSWITPEKVEVALAPRAKLVICAAPAPVLVIVPPPLSPFTPTVAPLNARVAPEATDTPLVALRKEHDAGPVSFTVPPSMAIP